VLDCECGCAPDNLDGQAQAPKGADHDVVVPTGAATLRKPTLGHWGRGARPPLPYRGVDDRAQLVARSGSASGPARLVAALEGAGSGKLSLSLINVSAINILPTYGVIIGGEPA
jgi:hypothetical protein